MDRSFRHSHASYHDKHGEGFMETRLHQSMSEHRERLSDEQHHQHAISLPNSVARMNNKTPSIPISNSLRRTASDHQVSQDEADADYKDYLFFSRVVHGISSKQQLYQDGFLRYENELSLHNILRTRQEASNEKPSFDAYNNFIAGYDINGRPLVYNPYPVVDPAEQDTMEAGIFDLDL